MNFNFFSKNAPDFGLAGKYSEALKASPKAGFSPETPQQWLQYRQNLIKQGFAPEDVGAAMQQFAPSTVKNTGEDELLKTIGETVKQQQWLNSPEGMKYQLELAREDAREKAKQGLMWGTLAKLPEAMANAMSPYGGPMGAAMAYQGMSAIPGIYSQTLASFPQIQAPGSSSQQYRYF